MNVQVQAAFKAFTHANKEMKELQSRIDAFEKEKEEIQDARTKLESTKQRMLKAFMAFKEEEKQVKSFKKTLNRYKKKSSINTVLAEMQEHGDWIHRRELTKRLNSKDARTSTGNKFNLKYVGIILTNLKREGQVHNDGVGNWRYGKGDRIYQQVSHNK